MFVFNLDSSNLGFTELYAIYTTSYEEEFVDFASYEDGDAEMWLALVSNNYYGTTPVSLTQMCVSCSASLKQREITFTGTTPEPVAMNCTTVDEVVNSISTPTIWCSMVMQIHSEAKMVVLSWKWP